MNLPNLHFDYDSVASRYDQFDLIVGSVRTHSYVNSRMSSLIATNSHFITRSSGYPAQDILSRTFSHYGIVGAPKEKDVLNVMVVGGGATLDFGKILTFNSLADYKDLAILLVPTNFGSAAELTPFATVWDYERGIKLSIELPESVDRGVFYDELALRGLGTLNAQVGFLDSVGHSFDSLVSRSSNPFLRQLATSNLLNSLEIFTEFEDLLDSFPSLKLQEISMLSGVCISCTKTSVSHGLSYWLTLSHGVPHGVAVGWMLQEVLKIRSKIPSMSETLHTSLLNGLGQIEFRNLFAQPLVNPSFDAFTKQIDQSRLDNFELTLTSVELREIFNNTVRSLGN